MIEKPASTPADSLNRIGPGSAHGEVSTEKDAEQQGNHYDQDKRIPITIPRIDNTVWKKRVRLFWKAVANDTRIFFMGRRAAIVCKLTD